MAQEKGVTTLERQKTHRTIPLVFNWVDELFTFINVKNCKLGWLGIF